MSEYYDLSTPTPVEQKLAPAKHKYSPPRAISYYNSRALPPRPQLGLAGAPGEGSPHQHTPWKHFAADDDVNSGDRVYTSNSTADEELIKVWSNKMATSAYENSDGQSDVISPRPRRPSSRLLNLWAEGDELVSPINTPATEGWQNYVVSPLSETWPGETYPGPYQSWYDDTSSDKEDQQPDSRGRTSQRKPSIDTTIPYILQNGGREMGHRYSDPGSPLSPGRDNVWFRESGPDIEDSPRLGDTPGHRAVQPQAYNRSTYSSKEQNGLRDDSLPLRTSTTPFEATRDSMFSSNRARISQKPKLRPLSLGGQSTLQDEAAISSPQSSGSATRQTGQPRTEAISAGLRRQRSRLGNLGASLYPPTPSRRGPPPGFMEVVSQLDKQGAVSPGPRVKNVLSRAKRGLGIGSD